MANYEALKTRVQELAERVWDLQAIEARYKKWLPAASEENMDAFARAKGFEKCSLLPGIGARLAAEIIIESME